VSELKQSLRVEKIANRAAAKLLDAKHPLGRGAAFAFALGVFYASRCEGVLTFGNPISNNAVKRYGLRQCDVLELRKLWISDVPPKNSESRILAIAGRIIRKRYPQLELLLTYCEGDEAASAYKAAGWIPQEAHQYVREVKVGGRWYSIRDALRKRISKQATESKKENRRKYIYPLTPAMAQRFSASKSVGAGGKGAASSTTATSTVKMPSAPDTGTGSIGRTLASDQAKSPASAPQQAADSSLVTKGRQSTKSATATATPVGSSL
jgi:hypothetical protein